MKEYYLIFLYDRNKESIDLDYLVGYTDNLYKANIYKRYLEFVKIQYPDFMVVMKTFNSWKRLCQMVKGMSTIGLSIDAYSDIQDTMNNLELGMYRGQFGNFAVYPHGYIYMMWETYGDQLSYAMYRLNSYCYALGAYAERFIKDEEYVSRIKTTIESIVRYVELYAIREECSEELVGENIPKDLQFVRDAFLKKTGLDIVDDGINEDYFFKVFSESDWLNAFSEFEWMGVDAT